MENNVVGWFEIPVKNMDRAIRFYEAVLDVKLTLKDFDEPRAFFPSDNKKYGSAGALVMNDKYFNPSKDGVLIYFNSTSGDLANELSKVESAGGDILKPKTLIKEDIGYMGMIIDTEGNRIAFHSMK
jgi:uncharacterized protein